MAEEQIKPLTWKRVEESVGVSMHEIAETEFGSYRVYPEVADKYSVRPYLVTPFASGVTNFKSSDEAKMAAERDLSARIRSALLPALSRMAEPVDEDRIIKHIEGYDVKEGDTRRRYTRAQIGSAIRLAALAAPPASDLREENETFQSRVAKAHVALFHDDPTDVPERVARFFEEALETVQAFGMTPDEAEKLLDYTFSRPVGWPMKEIGSAFLTLTSLCVVAGIDASACAEADLEKLQRPETIDRIRAKRATRHGRGPLPGIDPEGK